MRFAVTALAVVAGLTSARGANLSFTGTFTQDDNVQLFNFVVGAPSTVTLRTWSYAGGVNAAGATIARGGFDPILALFNSSGALIDQNDDGTCGQVAADAVSGLCFDTFLQVALAAGSYTVAVSQFDNFATGPNLANGFERTGEGNFTGGPFRDLAGGSQRDGHWAFDILNVQSAEAVLPGVPPTVPAVIPEPSAALLLSCGLALLCIRRRRAA